MDEKQNPITNPKKVGKDTKTRRNSATSIPEETLSSDRKVSAEASLAAQERIARRKEAKENQDKISTKSETIGGKVDDLSKTPDSRGASLDRRALAERRALREAKLAEQEQALANLKKKKDEPAKKPEISSEKPLEIRKNRERTNTLPKSPPEKPRESIQTNKSEKPQIIKEKPQVIKEKPTILSEKPVEPVENTKIPQKKSEPPTLTFGGPRLQPPDTVEKLATKEKIPENPVEPEETREKPAKKERLKPQSTPDEEKEPAWSSLLAWHGGFLSLPMVVLLYFVQHDFWIFLGFIFVILDLIFTLRQSAPIETPEYHHCKECFALLTVEPLCPQCGAQNEVLLQWQAQKRLDGKFAQIRFRQYRVVLSYLLSISLFLAFWTFM